MDELEILIQAILSLKDTTKSKQQILSELPKLQQQLQSDKNARINVTAGLDISKSKSLIQSQLNTLAAQTKVPVIKVGIDVCGNSNQSIGRTIASNLQDIPNASKTVTDKMVSDFRNAFGITTKLSQEAKIELKAALQEVSNAWNSSDIDKYYASIDKVMKLTAKSSVNIISPETQKSMQELKRLMSDGSKVFIDEKIRQDLQAAVGSAKELRTILSNVYGVGNWTFDKTKGGIGADVLIDPNFRERFQSVGEAIQYTNNNLRQLQGTLRTTTLDTMYGSMSPAEIENTVASILHLNNAVQQTSANSGGIFDGFEEIISDSERINSAAQSVRGYNQELERTVSTRAQLSNKNYFSNDTDFLKSIQSFREEQDAVKSLEDSFRSLGATVTSVEKRSSNGSTNGFLVSVRSANGEIEQFSYKLKNVNKDVEGAAEDWRYVLENITASDKAVQQLAISQKTYQDRLNAVSTKLQSQLDNIKSSAYIGSKPIDFGANEKLTQQYNNAVAAIEKLKTADKTTMASMQANANAEISTLRQMIAEVRNAEYAATQLRSKDIGTIKNIQTGNLDKFINQINNSKVPMEALKQDIDNLKVSLSSISKENPKSLTDFLNQLDIAKSKFASLKEFYKSIGKHNSELEKMAAAWKRQGVYTDELKSKISALKNELKQVAESGNTAELTAWVENYKKALSGMNVDSEKWAQLNNYLNEQVRLTKTILSLQTQIATVNPNRDENKLSGLRQALSARQQELAVLRQENSSMTELMSAEQQQKFIIEQTSREQERLLIAQQRAADIERRSEAITQRKADNLRAQISAYEAINTKAAKAYSNEFASIKKDLDLAKTPEQIEQIRAKFTSLKSEIKVAGKEGQTFFQKMTDGAKKFAGWMSLTTIISYIIRDIRKMLSTVVELDTALVDLRKTFKGTDADLKEFYYDANDVAKELGVTTAEVINQASAWSRLGFSTRTAATELAKVSSIFKSISPGIDAEKSQSTLTSIIKAFDIEVADAIKISDKINVIGNNFALSNVDAADALQRSAAAMAASNTSFERTLSLIVAGQEIQQDADVVGM